MLVGRAFALHARLELAVEALLAADALDVATAARSAADVVDATRLLQSVHVPCAPFRVHRGECLGVVNLQRTRAWRQHGGSRGRPEQRRR